MSFLKDVQENPPENPFCLIISLLNPHDVSLYPTGWQEAGYQNAVFSGPEFKNISLPKSYKDTLDSKPTTQATYLNSICHGKLSESRSSEGSIDYPLNYVKFYAYLHTLSDRLLGTVMDAIGKELIDNSVLIRTADHGEMAMAHGGLIEKNNSSYNETIRVPMMWVHPTFTPGRRDQLVSLIDLVPTLGSLAGSNLKHHSGLQGVDYSACLYDETIDVQHGLIFNFNPIGQILDGRVSPAGVYDTNLPPSYVANSNAPRDNAPGSIYALIKKDWKYVVYFDTDKDEDMKVDWANAQYELYHLKKDWAEMNNLLPINDQPEEKWLEKQKDMQKELTELIDLRNICKPHGWDYWYSND
ncbi:MAG: sulfatase-like hydrolase/transferase [Crocinitomicaceae bacterium]|nr:sulfatase-like hydrolase/transferase [Crocinitomicaceae bacterium]